MTAPDLCQRLCLQAYKGYASSNASCSKYAPYIEEDDPDSNSTSEYDDDSSIDLDTVSFWCAWIMCALCAVGLLGNMLSASVFSHRCMRSSINVLLTALCCIDATLLVISLPLFVGPQLSYLPDSPVWLHYLSNITAAYFYPIACMMQTASTWMFVVISMERYLAVCHPLKVKSYCTMGRARVAVVSVLLLSAAYNAVKFADLYLFDYRCVGANWMRANLNYRFWYIVVLYMATQYVMPVVAIGYLNTSVVRAIVNAQRSRSTLSSSQQCEHKTAIMMTIVIVVFTICYAPSAILGIIEEIVKDFYERDIAFLLTDFSNLCVMINSSINVLIYMLFSKKFRTIVIGKVLLTLLKLPLCDRLINMDFLERFINDKTTTTIGFGRSLRTLTLHRLGTNSLANGEMHNVKSPSMQRIAAARLNARSNRMSMPDRKPLMVMHSQSHFRCETVNCPIVKSGQLRKTTKAKACHGYVNHDVSRLRETALLTNRAPYNGRTGRQLTPSSAIERYLPSANSSGNKLDNNNHKDKTQLLLAPSAVNGRLITARASINLCQRPELGLDHEEENTNSPAVTTTSSPPPVPQIEPEDSTVQSASTINELSSLIRSGNLEEETSERQTAV